MDERRGYAEGRRAAHDALFVVLGAGLLVGAAKRRKTLSLLAILAAIAYFLWRRALTPPESLQTEPLQTTAPEQETREEQESEPAQAGREEALEEAASEKAVVAEPAVRAEVDSPEPTTEASAVEEAPPPEAGEPEAATEDEPIAEYPTEFEALDAALSALIAELEPVQATTAEEIRLGDTGDDRGPAEALEREDEAALVHTGRQLVHAGGGAGEGLPPLAVDDRHRDDDPAEHGEFKIAADLVEPADPRDDVLPPVAQEIPSPEVVPQSVVEPPAADTSTAGGLVGLIGRYSRRSPDGAPLPPPTADSAAQPVEPARAEEAPEKRVEPAAPAATEPDWL